MFPDSHNKTTILQATGMMEQAFGKGGDNTGVSWRTDSGLFNPSDGLLKGCLNMSPGWFQMGHSGPPHLPEVSLTLKASNAAAGGRSWLASHSETNALLAGAMAVIHPDQYRAGKDTMSKLPQCARDAGVDEIIEVVGQWESIFNAASLMMNRKSPYHRDHNSPAKSFDLLTTFGEYTDGEMSIPTLGQRFGYGPGTVMAFSGFLLRHGVNAVDGNRGCLAYYMRETMMKWVGVTPPKFMKYELLDAVGQEIGSRRVYPV